VVNSRFINLALTSSGFITIFPAHQISRDRATRFRARPEKRFISRQLPKLRLPPVRVGCSDWLPCGPRPSVMKA
jgi:hypothetical protein